MKKFKRIYTWILISVIAQIAILAYINFIYLQGGGTVRATMYQADTAQVKSRGFTLPGGAGDVSVSFDGIYAAYRQGNNVEIVNLDNRKSVRELTPEGSAITFFRWLPDRDMLIYSTREPDGNSGQVVISTYDIGPALDRSYPVIKSLPEGSEVTDIVLSPLTNVVYPFIKTSDTRARIYKFDIMDTLRSIMRTSNTTVAYETMYSDNLIYQEPDSQIQVRNGRTGDTSRLPVKDADKLLAVDDNDFIYAAGTDNNGRITAIYTGKLDQKAEEWDTITPEQPLDAKNVYVTAEGTIYSADTENKDIRALEGTGVTKYQGDLLTVLDNYVVSIDGDRLILKILKKQ